MLKARMTAIIPAEMNAELDKLQSLKVEGGNFLLYWDRFQDQVNLLAGLGVVTPEVAKRAYICRAVDKQAQTVADTLTSDVATTTERMVAAFSAHYRNRATRSAHGKPVADDTVALSVVVPNNAQSYRGRGGGGPQRGRGSRGRGGGRAGRGGRATCWTCGKVGHIARHCRYTQESKEDSPDSTALAVQDVSTQMQNLNMAPTTTTLFCMRCGSKAHAISDCHLTKRVLKMQARLVHINDGVSGLMIRVYYDFKGEKESFSDQKVPLDSASDRHLTPYVDYIMQGTLQKLKTPILVGGINQNAPLYATHTGTMLLPLSLNDQLVWQEVKDTLVVPKLPCTIVSSGWFSKNGADILTCGVKNGKPGKTIVVVDGVVRMVGVQAVGSARTYVLLWQDGAPLMALANSRNSITLGARDSIISNSISTFLGKERIFTLSRSSGCDNIATRKLIDRLILLHKSYGHPCAEVLFELVGHSFPELATSTHLRDLCYVVTRCPACMLGKAKAISHPAISQPRAAILGSALHVDTFGPSQTRSLSGNRYSGVMVHAPTSYTFTVFGARKNVVAERLVPVLRYVARCLPDLRELHLDNAPEFVLLKKECIELGYVVKLTTPGESVQNAIAERGIGVVTEKTRVNLIEAGAKPYMWAEAWQYSCMQHNMLPRRSLSWRSPGEVLFGTKGHPEMLKPFGCAAYVKLPDGLSKLGPRAKLCVFLGVDPQAKGYRVWDLENRCVYVRWNVRFDTSFFPWKSVAPVGGGDVSSFDDDEDEKERPVPNLNIPALPASIPPAPLASVPAIPPPLVPALPVVAAPGIDDVGVNVDQEREDEAQVADVQEDEAPPPAVDDVAPLVGDSDSDDEAPGPRRAAAPRVLVPDGPAAAPRHSTRANAGVPPLRTGGAEEESTDPSPVWLSRAPTLV